MDVSEYIKVCLSREEYSFTWDELRGAIGKPTTAIKKEVTYLTSKKELIALRQNFYLIIPPRYATQGKLPIELYIHKLFKYLNREYYLGGFSAAKFHGASHQQIQKEYVFTTKPALLSISKGGMDIQFFTLSNWPKSNIIRKKSDAGYFNVSDPILTIADLIYHQTKLGGLNRMLANIEELLEEVQLSDLQELLKWYPNKSVLQRLGFLIEYLQPESELLNPIMTYLVNNRYYPVLLNTFDKGRPGAVDNGWKVAINLELESDI
ncbi:type IV toxin-antitoxin system AbiEi family antitoxin [Pricia sp. S334]|uniref:Type IV toxin-antitoxin system AbiEi family antitoxin n=1 Tax=Pricia mediterranea TaxID=3076079 RepID=A0ABU3L3M7_9FLAO|nr:type IV toxin-antitoxin system AbiEi family antitoxin [Pricia sp. S334]MDT7828225.1 type IV toxin-antitoxin system AbiEi family antitoxin [Pricia sp. S334]